MGFMASCFAPLSNQLVRRLEMMAHNIYVTKLVEPKVVHRVGCRHKVAFTELLVHFRGSDIEFVQDPLLDETFVSCGLLTDQVSEGIVCSR